MKDPTIPDPTHRKKIMFYDTEKNQVDLRVRLKNDNLNQSTFFRAMIDGYLNRDTRILDYLYSFKEQHSLAGVSHHTAEKKMTKKYHETKNNFGLNPEDIENFFDIMDEEHPEL